MPTEMPGPLNEFFQEVADYLPTLAAGLVVLGLGLVAGWLARRAVMGILVWLRLDRLGGRMGWRAAFGKGDVRAALYKLLGTVAMILVDLVFLDNALQIWGLVVLSRSLHAMIVYLPNLMLVGIILGVGTSLSNIAARRIEETLEDEKALRPRLVAKVFKAALLCFVGALALWQLSLARQIVLAAFLIVFGAVGVAFALALGLGTSRAVQRGWEALLDRSNKEAGDDQRKG